MESRLKQLPKAIFFTVYNKSAALYPISKLRSWQNSGVLLRAKILNLYSYRL